MKNCMLFKRGVAHTFKGASCEIVKVSSSQVEDYKSKGWFGTVDEAYADTNDSGKLSNEEIRQAAKDAGLDNWETGRINGLKKALGYEHS